MKTGQSEKEPENGAIENPDRRRLSKRIVIGAGSLAVYHALPVKWSQPIIQQIVLPAHAQTSPTTTVMCNQCTASIELDQNDTGAYIFDGTTCGFEIGFAARFNNDHTFLFSDNSDGLNIIEGVGANWTQTGITGNNPVGGATRGDETRQFEQIVTRVSTGEQYRVEFTAYRTGDSTTNFMATITIDCTTGPLT